MGNEMGNSNTSGLHEEENSTTQVQERSVQEAGQADGKEVENHNASLAEVKNHSKKENGVATNVPNGAADPQVANQISHEREEKETEVKPPAESPKVEVKSNDTGASRGSGEIQPNSMSNDSKEHQKLLGNTDGEEGENNIFPVSEDKDYQEKEINGFPYGVPKEAEDPHIVNQISDEREQETEVLAPAESPKFEVETNNEAGSEVCDIQPTSPSKHSTDHEIQESNLKENLLHISDHHLKKQTSIKKEEEGTETSTSETVQSSLAPDPQEFEDLKFDQPELANIHVDPPKQDSNKSLHLHEDIRGSNLNCTSEENGHAISTNISKDMNETVVSGSNLEVEIGKDHFTVKESAAEEVSCEDSLEIEDTDGIGNDLGEKPVIKSDSLNAVGIKCNGEIPIEKNPISTDSPKAESEVTFTDESPQNPQIGVSEATDSCIVLAAETGLAEKESEPVENKPSDCLTHSCEESVKESKIDSENLSQSESLMIETEGENNQGVIEDFNCCGGNEDCIDEPKVAKNGGLVDEHSNRQNEVSVEQSEDSQKEVEMVPESGAVSRDSAPADCKREEESEKRQIFEEIEDKTKPSYRNVSNTDARENEEQSISPVEQEEISLTEAPFSVVQPQDNQQNNEMQSINIQNGNDSISELKPEINGEFLVTEASPFDSKKSMAETLVPVDESATEKPGQDISQHTAETMMAAAEANAQVNNVSEQYADAQESLGRLSTESNSNNSNSQAQMQKSPSFDLDLRIEARTEESDRTPLPYQDKTATEDFSGEQDVRRGIPIARAQDKLQCHAMPAEEKVVRMERSDSEKLKTPFLGFLKEKEDAHITVKPQIHGNNAAAKRADKESLNLHTKEVTATSKEKRKPRSSLFTACLCCTTVLN